MSNDFNMYKESIERVQEITCKQLLTNISVTEAIRYWLV